MNFTKKLLGIAGALLCASFAANAQFNAASGGSTPAISGLNSAVFIVPGITTTNIPSNLQVACAIGPYGFGLTVNQAGTNSVTTTNTTFIFETSGDGVNYATNSRPTFLVNPIGVQYAPYFTNVLASTATFNVGNAAYIRLRSIQNTNIDSIFITNLNVSRQ